MSKNTKKVTPKLRFSEFRGQEKWSKTTIGELGSFYYGKSAPKWSLEENAPTKCVRYGELYTKFDAVISETYSRTNIDPASLRFSKGGEILVPRVGEKPEDFGKCVCYLPLSNIAIGEMISVFETNQNSLFYTYYFRNMYKQFAKVVEGQNVKNLYYVELEPLPLFRPELAEQKKIADCLSSIDALISVQSQKVEALKTHKKGLMQQLFPREGETVPRMRFPEFRDAGEWEEKQLNKLGELVSGLTYSPSDVRGTGLLVLRSSNVQNGEITLDDNVYVRADIKGANLSKPNDILICVRNGSKALIGKNAMIPEGMPLCTHGAFMTVFRAPAAKFVFQLFQSRAYQKQVDADLGATINSINGSQFLKYKFFVPSPKEQQKIADFLSSIDDFISSHSQKLESLKTHKKGLMQQLFPSMEADSE